MRAEVSRWHDLSGRLDELQAEPVLHARDGPSLFYPLLQTTVCKQMFVSERRERSVDVMRAATVDADLDRLISRRASQERSPGPDEREASYAESVRRFNTRRRDANRAAWCEYHRLQAGRHRAVLESLIDRHEAEVERLQATDERRTG